MNLPRILTACIFLTMQAFLLIPQHEYMHCLIGWVALDAEPECSVRFIDHIDSQYTNDAVIIPWNQPAPWWEHPLIYSIQITWGALTALLAISFAATRKGEL